MINANELRLGNWVLHDGKIMRVKILMPGKTSYLPIPITPEILEKAGFEYDLIVYSKSTIWLAPALGSNVFDVFLSGLSGGITTRISYVHELQNLAFIIWGEELEINLP